MLAEKLFIVFGIKHIYNIHKKLKHIDKITNDGNKSLPK